MNERVRARVIGLMVAMTSFALSGDLIQAADWEWTLAPYAWGAGLKMDLTVNDNAVASTEVDFSDLLDKTDMAGMVHFEGRNGKGGFFVDALFMALSDERTTAPPPPLPGGAQIDAELNQFIAEGGGFWRLGGGESGLDILFGVRAMGIDSEVDITFPSPSTTKVTTGSDETFIDGFVGARYSHPIGGKWDWALRGDVGTGDTDVTWNAVGTVGVRFGDTGKYSLRFGYRQMEMDFENDDSGAKIETDITFSGAIAGFVIKW